MGTISLVLPFMGWNFYKSDETREQSVVGSMVAAVANSASVVAIYGGSHFKEGLLGQRVQGEVS